MSTWLNEQPATAVSIAERGLLLGDGHFTTIEVNQGRLCLWPLHQHRLQQANRVFGFNQPDWQALLAFVNQAIETTMRGCIRITFSRGQSGRGYQGQWPSAPNRIISLSAYPEHYQQWRTNGVDCAIAAQRLPFGGSLSGIKTVGRAEQVLLKQELSQIDSDELVVLDPFGDVIESSAGNLFFIDGTTVVTPQLSYSGIAGVMRQHIIGLLPELGYGVTVRPIAAMELPQFKGAITTNCLMGAVPVRSIGASQYPIHPLCSQINETL